MEWPLVREVESYDDAPVTCRMALIEPPDDGIAHPAVVLLRIQQTHLELLLIRHPAHKDVIQIVWPFL